MKAMMLDSLKLITVYMLKYLCFFKNLNRWLLCQRYITCIISQFNVVICIGQKSLSCACIM